MVTGPHLHNFADIARRMREAGALCTGADVQEVGDALDRLLGDPETRARMAAAGTALVEEGRGALARTLALIVGDMPRG